MSNNEAAGKALNAIRIKFHERNAAEINLLADQSLTHWPVLAMQAKLRKKREQGYGGWWSPQCSVAMLRKMLQEHVQKGDMIDVMNFAAMIYLRELADLDPSLAEKIHG